MEVYAKIALSIIRRQETIIGPVAIEQAEHIPHLKLDWKGQDVQIDGDPISVIDNLVRAYGRLFGQVSVEVSKQAAAPFLSKVHPNHLPHTLE
jgi:hypothetical protein